MNCVKLLPVVLSCLVLGAHYLRVSELGVVMLWASVPLVLLLRRQWVPLVVTGMLLWGGYVWLDTAVALVALREAQGLPWTRMALIMGGVAVFSAASPLAFLTEGLRRRYRSDGERALAGPAAFTLTFLLFGVVQTRAPLPAVLLERFLPGGGWLEGFWLAVYAGWLADAMLERGRALKLRPRIWMLFSIVFFAQLAVGLAGAERFLMTGSLHLPVPALIMASPLFRGDGFFMLSLFAATVLFVGPAWCSHLCYIGAWDDVASRMNGGPRPLPAWGRTLRFGTLVGVIAAALILRWADVLSTTAAVPVIAFMVAGIGVMALWSRKSGAMAHCVSFCPISWLSTRLGRVSPFRLKIEEGCSDCGTCSTACRYDALSEADIARRRPGKSCTLCGDCLGRCNTDNIVYSFPGLTSAGARALFVVLAVSLHALFMGVARM